MKWTKKLSAKFGKFNKKVKKTIGIGNKHSWRILLVITVVLGAILIGRPLYSIISNGIEISRLEDEKALYLASIRRDSTLIENLKNDEFLEQYAREKYFMQGKNEQVFIVE